MRTWLNRLAGLVAVLVAAAFVAAAGVGGWLYWDRVEFRSEQTIRQVLPPLAAKQIPQVFGYDYQTVERSLTEAAELLTPQYRQEFEQRAAKDIIPQARQRQVISQANVVGTGLLDAHRDSASVMVFMNRTVSEKSQKPVYDGSRLRVDYRKVDGRWLINYITPI